jgi:hypothetical protein
VSGATPDPSAFIVSISPRDKPILVRTKAIRLVADHVGSSSAYLSRPIGLGPNSDCGGRSRWR